MANGLAGGHATRSEEGLARAGPFGLELCPADVVKPEDVGRLDAKAVNLGPRCPDDDLVGERLGRAEIVAALTLPSLGGADQRPAA